MNADQPTLAPAEAPKVRPNRGNAGKGRPRGSANKATTELRAVIKKITDSLAPEVEAWIRKGAKRNPLAAANLVVNLLEFAVPKLQRTELTGVNGEPLKVTLVKGL